MEYKHDENPAPTPLGGWDRWLRRRSVPQHGAAVAVSLGVLAVVNVVLNALYARSNFPVPYAEGQTSFDADQVKAWYAHMSRLGSLDVYVATQCFDFVFIAAMAVAATTVGSLIVRLAERSRVGWGRSLGRRLGLAVMWLIPLGGAFDAVENLCSFPMLARPETFWSGWAIAQSTAAVTKFALIASGFAALGAALVVLVVASLMSRRRRNVDASA